MQKENVPNQFAFMLYNFFVKQFRGILFSSTCSKSIRYDPNKQLHDINNFFKSSRKKHTPLNMCLTDLIIFLFLLI